MLKSERYQIIINLINSHEIVSTAKIMSKLKVSDMTVRRDLTELESKGILNRVHGGAVKNDKYPEKELSHEDKKIINISDKNNIAENTINLITEEDIIFLGPGTTIEILASKIKVTPTLVVTNCLPVFQKLVDRNIKTYLIGGELRKNTGAFFGDMSITTLEKINFNKAFISCNGIIDDNIMTATVEEGRIQQAALNNSAEKYLLVDSSKYGKQDFYSFYDLNKFTAIVQENEILYNNNSDNIL